MVLITMANMPRQGAKNLPKLDFLTSKYMDWILSELKKSKRLEINELAKRMRSSTRRKREKFLIEKKIVDVEEYKDNMNRNRKRMILTKKGEEIIKKVFDLEAQI